MNFRPPTNFPAAYNPQQWGPVNRASPHTASHLSQNSRILSLAPRPLGPDEPVATPPPPYSPRREPESQDSPRRPADTISPSDTTSPDTEASQHTTPLSSATALSPDFLSKISAGRAPPPQQLPSANGSPNISAAPTFPPPPPPPAQGSSTYRSTSKNHADRVLSSLSSREKNTGTTSPVNAIDALHVNAASLHGQAPDASAVSPTIRAPAARRAVSTGAIGVARTSSGSASHSPPTWEPGMPLPPPPPGPPPASARSQSLSRPIESPSVGSAPSLPVRTRRPPGHGTSLETVPPTPADWREETPNQKQGTWDRPNGPAPLHIDTGSILRNRRSGYEDHVTATATTPSHLRRDSSASGLFRSPAVRNRSAKGLRERRSESKNGKGRTAEDSAVEVPCSIAPWDDDTADVRPTDLLLSGGAARGLSRRASTRRTPRSGKALPSLDSTLHTAGKRLSSGKAVSFETASQPSEPVAFQGPQGSPKAPPHPPEKASEPLSEHSLHGPSTLLQHSPLRPCDHPSHEHPIKLSLAVTPSAGQRPISHILHSPNQDDVPQVPLTPSTLAKQRPVSDMLGPESPEAFAERTVQRHRSFAQREAAAANDSERLDIFIQYAMGEFKIRRERYTRVFEKEDVDTDQLVKDLLRGTATKRTPDLGEVRHLAQANTSRRTSIASSALADSSSQEDSSISRKHESPSSATTNSSAPTDRPESGWVKDYVPCLSPIASMSVVTGQDEMDSRGRAPSRWWEDPSQSGSAVNDGFNVLGRSKRESKYMGVPLEARNSPALFEQRMSGMANHMQWQTGEPSRHHAYDSNEYPPEKVGWQEEHTDSMVPPPPPPLTPSSAHFTSDPRKSDVSRLVTLPPPYPRHHPAVNNNHPELADIRSVVRSLHEKEQPEALREFFQSELLSKRKRADSWCNHQRSLLGQDVQYRIEHGEITEEQFDELETELEGKIEKSDRDITQAEFDLFQNKVVSPLHALFAERITLATSSLDKLSSRLFSDAHSRSPNLPQEEGDEQPELLEKLTQLKWLFEARETLHRQTYDLLSERNEKYKAMILLPYKQSQNNEKYVDAENFFAQDARDRKLAFEKATSDRAHAFLVVIESNVSRGVEVQLDAFWQIAPSLKEVLYKIPSDLSGFEIRIPADEYAENPSYYKHPLQYLYSLLSHAEKSTYQFIESQVNLLCLLHEIRTCALTARCIVEANERPMSDMKAHQNREEKRLTEDLKEKVGVVEGQWNEGLGEELMGVRERVRERLLEEGGWNDEEEAI
ncbi:MAG: hypothetical protein Q9217_004324 [Psora testacea]